VQRIRNRIGHITVQIAIFYVVSLLRLFFVYRFLFEGGLLRRIRRGWRRAELARC